jgi:hypothetical protein
MHPDIPGAKIETKSAQITRENTVVITTNNGMSNSSTVNYCRLTYI